MIKPVPGPLGKSVDDLVIGMKILTNQAEHTQPVLPWKESDFLIVQKNFADESKKFKVGIMFPPDHLPISTSVRRALSSCEA